VDCRFIGLSSTRPITEKLVRVGRWLIASRLVAYDTVVIKYEICAARGTNQIVAIQIVEEHRHGLSGLLEAANAVGSSVTGRACQCHDRFIRVTIIDQQIPTL
jgi:hypothetical protein